MPKILYQDCIEVVKTNPQERISERSQVIGVHDISRRGSVEVIKSVPQERIYERGKVIEVPKILYQECIEVVKTNPHERISERSQVIGVHIISRRGSAEVIKSVPQERIYERMGKQSQVIEVPEISYQESVEDQILKRTEEQLLDMEHGCGMIS